MFVSDAYRPTIGGLERSVEMLAHAMTDAGHEVVIVTASNPDAPEMETETTSGGKTLRVFRHPMSTQCIPGALVDAARPFHPTVVDPLFRRAVKRVLASFEPDVIYCNGWSLLSVIGPANKAGIPVVSTARDYGYACATKYPMFSDGSLCDGPELTKCIKHSLDHYGPKGLPLALGLRTSHKSQTTVTWTSISGPIARFADGTPYEIPGMEVISSQIPDEAARTNTSARPPTVPEEPYLLFVGQFSPMKGVDVLLSAHHILRSTYGLDIPLVLVGTRHSRELGLDSANSNVIVLTDVPHSDVMDVWKHARIGVVPSTAPEGFGQVAVEALAMGTPVVVAGHGGLVDIVEDGVEGVYFEPGNAEDLAAKLAGLWNDDEGIREMSEAGPRKASRFTVSAVMPQMMEVFERTIRGGKS